MGYLTGGHAPWFNGRMTTRILKLEVTTHTDVERLMVNRPVSDRITLDGKQVALLPVGQGAAWMAEHGQAVIEEFDGPDARVRWVR